MIFAEAYWPSLFLAGVLLVSQVAYGLYLVPMNYLTQTAGLPRFSALASGTGAAVILTTVLLFARTYGAAGVSYGTVAAYLMMAIAAFALTLANKLEIEWHTWVKAWPEIVLSCAALVCSVAALTLPDARISELGLAISGLIFVAGATLVTLRRSSGDD
jgi:Na+-driven multidrug efflux pump